MDYIRLINEFGKPKAKIDFITMALPSSIQSEADAYHFTKRIENPDSIKTSKKWGYDWLTIHDPTLPDLQFLLDEHPNTAVSSIEIAVDFCLKDGSNDPVRLRELHSWLKVSLFPQRHKLMRMGRRKFYDQSNNSIKRDMLKTRSGDESVYWADLSYREQVRLYIKTIDDEKPIERHCVRLEVTLFCGGCHRAQLFWVGNLPRFIAGMRPYLSPFLNVAKGIKPSIKRTRSKDPAKALKATYSATKEKARVERWWKQCGSAWAAKHNYKVIADADTNRLIGGGLKNLQDRLRQLKLTRKVADDPDYEVWKPA